MLDGYRGQSLGELARHSLRSVLFYSFSMGKRWVTTPRSRGYSTGSNSITGAAYFEVVRMDRSSKYVVIHRTDDLDKARALANREWAADRAA